MLQVVKDKQAVWFLSTAKSAKLEDRFQNRLLKLATEPTTAEEMVAWLFELCTKRGIPFEDEAIVRVVEKSNRVVGTALHALTLAYFDDETGLTLDLVENDWVAKLDE